MNILNKCSKCGGDYLQACVNCSNRVSPPHSQNSPPSHCAAGVNMVSTPDSPGSGLSETQGAGGEARRRIDELCRAGHARFDAIVAYLDEAEERRHPIARVHQGEAEPKTEIVCNCSDMYRRRDMHEPECEAATIRDLRFALTKTERARDGFMGERDTFRAELDDEQAQHRLTLGERDTLRKQVEEDTRLMEAAHARMDQLEGELSAEKRKAFDLEGETMTLTSERDTARMGQDELRTEVNRLNAELVELKRQQPYRDEDIREFGRRERDGEVAKLRAVADAARAFSDGPGLGGELGVALSNALDALNDS